MNPVLHESQLPAGLLLPKNGKFFTRFASSDRARLMEAENLWEEHKDRLPYPKSKIPPGDEVARLVQHHYNYWHEMFLPRQLLALSTLLGVIMKESDETLQEMLLSAFSGALQNSNTFCRFNSSAKKWATGIEGIFARHDFQPKTTFCEQTLWGNRQGRGTVENCKEAVVEGKSFCLEPQDTCFSGGKYATKKSEENIVGSDGVELFGQDASSLPQRSYTLIVTDPPYVGNVNYAELADFFYVWLRLALKDRYPHFAPEYSPKAEEIVENRTRGKSIQSFYEDLAKAFSRVHDGLSDNGLLVFTFHHTDQEGTIWEGLLNALCETGFEIAAVYPIHGESESSLHLMDKENVSYDLIHVCRKRTADPQTRSWAGIRQEIRRRARDELKAIEDGRYGKEPLPPPDVRLICIGKCLELFSAHYRRVVDHRDQPVSMHGALQDIGTIVDQLVTRDRPFPPELEGTDAVSYAWLRLLRKTQREIQVDELNKGLRAMQVTAEELKQAGLIIRGRTGRGRTYEVKQPHERLNPLLEKLKTPMPAAFQRRLLFDEAGEPVIYDISLVDLVHLLVGLAKAGESVSPWLQRFSQRRPQVRAALRFLRNERPDWVETIDRILPIIEGAPLLRTTEKN
ncbi:MAG: hypothetical protein HY644_04480 [Acidobacteria bacterium]|nr:hypothetical protein [Acidobacteriota bacterium]